MSPTLTRDVLRWFEPVSVPGPPRRRIRFDPLPCHAGRLPRHGAWEGAFV